MTGNLRPQCHPRILDIEPERPGAPALPPGIEPIRLSSNESALGPSPAATAAYHAAAARLHRYPDGAHAELRRAIAAAHGLDVERVVCGNGSDELIDLLIRAYLGADDELVVSEQHFPMVPIHGRTQGARIVIASERGLRADVDALLDAITPRTRMLALANPNNPAGLYLAEGELRRLHAGLPRDVLLLLDAAYGEYVLAQDYEPGARLVRDHDNVVMTRSFSKAYGLAGLRIGWAYAPPPVVDALQRVRSPFNVNAAALAAAAAAVADRAHLERVRAHNARWLARSRERFEALGLAVAPSVTNFYLIDFDPLPGASAAAATAFLHARGVIPGPVIGNRLRITIGLDRENEAALAAIAEYVATLP